MPKRREGMIFLYDEERERRLVGSLIPSKPDSDVDSAPPTEFSWWNFSLWTDEELHELIARNPSARDALMARSELRSRERWSGPAKWSLVVSVVVVLISTLALIRTL